MPLTASYLPHKLDFKFEAGTSRGVLRQKQTYILRLSDSSKPNLVAEGEAGPLTGLSPDDDEAFESWLSALCDELTGLPAPGGIEEIHELLKIVPDTRPALKFAFESALLHWINGASKYFDSNFLRGKSIPINGLVWMGDWQFMKAQIDEKIAAGYTCIKLKIGALDFEEECALLSYIRENYGADLILRVDANGAFSHESALQKLQRLATFDLHSIEQPIAAGQPDEMKELCAQTALPIALDEELIGVTDATLKYEMLDYIRPQYIILKPTLLGGFKATDAWIEIAQSLGIGWWITSALESNIGLQAIAQYTASKDYHGHQGLGTGQLYSNNFDTDLYIENGFLHSREPL